MTETPEISLSLLQSMVQRVLDGQTMLREDNRAMRRRLSRLDHRMSALEHAMLGLQNTAVDRTDGETGVQDQLDAVLDRLERLEKRAPSP